MLNEPVMTHEIKAQLTYVGPQYDGQMYLV